MLRDAAAVVLNELEQIVDNQQQVVELLFMFLRILTTRGALTREVCRYLIDFFSRSRF